MKSLFARIAALPALLIAGSLRAAPIAPAGAPDPQWQSLLRYLLFFVMCLLLAYAIRHYVFTLNRLFGRQRHPYVNIDTADWPSVVVLVPAHNEEKVIEGALKALLEVDYPQGKYRIVALNDRSTDKTPAMIDSLANQHPERIFPFHRSEGKAGKAAAIKDAGRSIDSEIIIVFDADYLPGKGLIKQLVAPFFDPEVGAVMGRVVPHNVGLNVLTRLLDMERAGGYQVDQQARMNLDMVPQYGGTVGGVRRVALQSVGGWDEDSLAEDTDMTFRLLLKGWKTVYQNRSECYEEVPESWPIRIRQIVRWAKGHNQVWFRYVNSVVFSRNASVAQRIDGVMLLGVYLLSPVLLSGWILAIILFYLHATLLLSGVFAVFAITAYSALGSFAAFYEISTAVYLDGGRQRIRLLPFNFFNFLISLLAISGATLRQLFIDPFFAKKLSWDKTERFREPK